MNFDCQEVFKKIDDHVDHTLDASEIAAMEAHLEKCEVCRCGYRFEESFLREMREKIERVGIPEQLRDRISRLISGAPCDE